MKLTPKTKRKPRPERFGASVSDLVVTRAETKTELARSHDHDSSTHPDLPNKPGKTNWVERTGGLPSFIKRVAKHIMYDGNLSESHAIAAAVKQCRDGRFGDKGLAAYAQFRAKAAASRGKSGS